MRPDAMIGAATGSVSGFFVIDPDVPKRVSRGKIGELTPDGGAAWHTSENERKLLAALAHISADNRLRVCAALNSLGWGDRSREIWDEWSRVSAKFDPADQQKTWEGFDPHRAGGATHKTINFEAKSRGSESDLHGEWGGSLICAASIAPEPVSWLWPYWLARGKLHIIAGSPGSVKTTIVLKAAAIISSGGCWPGGAKSPRGNIIIWSGEDSQKDTLVPRLMAAGADMNRVHFIGPVTRGTTRRAFDPAVDVAVSLIEQVGDVALLIFDPVVAATGTDSHKNAETRRDLPPVIDLAEAANAAVMGVHHLTKGTEGRAPIDRITGSLAFGAVPRVVWAATQQQPSEDGNPGLRVLTRAKNNIGPDNGGWAYELQVVNLTTKNDEPIETTTINFGEFVEGSAKEILSKAEDITAGSPGAEEEAAEFLRDYLSAGPKLAKDVTSAARAAAHSLRTLMRAKRELKVKSVKASDGCSWAWVLPEWPP